MKSMLGTNADLIANIHMLQEAYAVMHGIPVERQFSDRELEGYQYELSVAKTDIEEVEASHVQNR